jgi:hypothetical protein
MTGVPAHLTSLRLVQPASIDIERVKPLFAEAARGWLGTPVEGQAAGSRRFLTDLSLPIHEHAPSLVFRKAAFVDVGATRRTSDGYAVEIGWRSSSLAPLFPVFAGHLTVTPTELRLEGYYAPPGGEFGAVLDKAFLGIAARGTARWFLDRAAAAASQTTVADAAPTPEEDLAGAPRTRRQRHAD